MRIGVDIRQLQSATGSGQRGIGRYTLDLVDGLSRHAAGHELVLFARQNAPANPAIDGLRRTCEFVDVPGRMWMDEPKPLWQKIPKLRTSRLLHKKFFDGRLNEQTAAMEDAVSRARLDVLHFPAGLDVGSYPLGEYACPTVMTFLDAIVLEYREMFFDQYPWYLQDYYRAQLANLKSAAKVVSISDASREHALLHAGLSADQVVTVYPAVSDLFTEPHPESLTDPLTKRKPYILFNSVPDPHKNPIRVIEAFAQADLSPEVQLIFISPKSPPFVDQLTQAADQAGIKKRFTITGFLEERVMVALYQHALALVSPSLIEGFGLPVAQAMRAGVPVITSNRSAQAEIARGAGLLVTPENVSEIAGAIAKVAQDPGLRAQMSAAGRELGAKFNLEQQTADLLEVYRSVAKNS